MGWAGIGFGITTQQCFGGCRILGKGNSAANRRHMALSISYNALSREDRIEMLEKYIADEHVGFYRNLAIKKLNDQKDQ